MKKITIFLFAAIAVFALVSCNNGNKPHNTVREYYDYLKAGDYKNASQMLFEDEKSVEATVYLLETVNYKVLEYKIVDEIVSDDGLTASVKVKTKVSTEYEGQHKIKDYTQDVPLSNKDGMWKIDYVDKLF
jgi:hypothetical protein